MYGCLCLMQYQEIISLPFLPPSSYLPPSFLSVPTLPSSFCSLSPFFLYVPSIPPFSSSLPSPLPSSLSYSPPPRFLSLIYNSLLVCNLWPVLSLSSAPPHSPRKKDFSSVQLKIKRISSAEKRKYSQLKCSTGKGCRVSHVLHKASY